MKRAAMIHSKMKRLQRRLELPLFSAAGLLECLWHLAAREAPCGDIGKLTDEDIAWALEWPDDPERLVSALVECGWLDRHPQHRLIVHDWHEHADEAVKKFVSRNRLDFVTGQGATMADAGETNPEVSRHVETCIDGVDTCPPPARVSQKPEARSQKPKNDEDLQTEPKSEEGGPSSSLEPVASESPPEQMPDGTSRLTERQLAGLDELRRDFTDSLVLTSAVLTKFRRLFDAGATLALVDEEVRIAATAQRRRRENWRASRLDYFEPAIRRRLDELREEPPPSNGAAPAAEPVFRPTPDPQRRSACRGTLTRFLVEQDEAEYRQEVAAYREHLLDRGFGPDGIAAELAEVEQEAARSAALQRKLPARQAALLARTGARP